MAEVITDLPDQTVSLSRTGRYLDQSMEFGVGKEFSEHSQKNEEGSMYLEEPEFAEDG